MKCEIERLISFHRLPTPVSALRLANSGFFSTGDGDEVMCFSCGVTYSRWKRSNNVHKVHLLLSPRCLHANGKDNSNIQADPFRLPGPPNLAEERPVRQEIRAPTDGTSPNFVNMRSEDSQLSNQEAPVVSRNVMVDRCRRQLLRQAVGDVQESGPVGSHIPGPRGHIDNQIHPRVKYPRFEDPADRLHSFWSWPPTNCKAPEDLAIAGFFYTGNADCVRCFCCGLGLKKWMETTDPWEVHVRHEPSCDYVRNVRGPLFISQTVLTIERERERERERRKAEKNEAVTRNIEEPTYNGMDAAREALELGFDKETITRHVDDLVKNKGLEAFNTEMLMQSLNEDRNASSEEEEITGAKGGN